MIDTEGGGRSEEERGGATRRATSGVTNLNRLSAPLGTKATLKHHTPGRFTPPFVFIMSRSRNWATRSPARRRIRIAGKWSKNKVRRISENYYHAPRGGCKLHPSGRSPVSFSLLLFRENETALIFSAPVKSRKKKVTPRKKTFHYR